MKPCAKNRKLMTWLALDALEAGQASALREHLAQCAGCRRYWEEISNVTERLAAAAPDAGLEASATFHRGVARKLRAAEAGSAWERLGAWLRGSRLTWRVALPACAAVVIALVALAAPWRPPVGSPPAPHLVQVAPAPRSESDLAPTIANYQRVANQSLEKFSELLIEQGNKRLPPAAAVYTVSGMELGEAAF